MAWRGVHICNAAGLTLRQGQLVVAQESGEITFPLEDIAYIILDTPQITITSSLLAAMLKAGIAVVQSDEKHIPCGVAFSFHAHWRQGEIAHSQVSVTEPFKKRAWQAIVRQKIHNQAAVLDASRSIETEGAAKALLAMVPRVRSGDLDNTEARAARAYWSALFRNFRRADQDDWRNSALNYGYAVVRACLARSLSAYGFIPALGLHHRSVTNPFNLADDLIEPFRPFVDFLVLKTVGRDNQLGEKLTKEARQAMAQAPFEPVMLGGESMSLLLATERVAQNLATAVREGDLTRFALPTFSLQERLL